MDKIKDLINKFLKKGDGDEPDKRVKISKAQQQMMLAAAVASVTFGVCLVLSIHFVQYSIFYSQVLTEEDESIATYQKSIIASGACVDSNKDGVLSDRELEVCDPDMTPLSSTTGSLRNNVAVNMAENEDLDSVERVYLSACYRNKKRIDYTADYAKAMTEEDKDLYLSLIKMCSALRTIPDALPAQQNVEALMSSLNEVFIIAGWEPESLSPGDNVSSGSDDEGGSGDNLGTMEVSVSVEGDVEVVSRVLQSTEKSIRIFEPITASITWSESGIELSSQMNAYYAWDASITEQTKTVNASGNKKGNSR